MAVHVCRGTIDAIEKMTEADGVAVVGNWRVRFLEDRERLRRERLAEVYRRLNYRSLVCYPARPGRPDEGFSFAVYQKSALHLDLTLVFRDEKMSEALATAQKLIGKPAYLHEHWEVYSVAQALEALAPARVARNEPAPGLRLVA